ncbi:MAG: VTC domain-containing protein, partial [Clostridia bacterium]|nr:VTC domain-containing protein [Clostridia bacterium]
MVPGFSFCTRKIYSSLYFDDLLDTALREKQSDISRREKFRIRYYDGDTSRLRLEKKIKQGGMGCKLSAPLTAADMAIALVLAFGLGLFISF